MLIFNKNNDLSKYLFDNSSTKTSIGFVPTMGALHKGHLSLLEHSLKENDITVISIFVNPTQFNNPEDLEKYPRTLESDIEKIKGLDSSIIIFAPSVDDIYNGNINSTHFEFDGLENLLEGKFRPGHFDGVGTIVKRLFEIVNPTNAYFGEKDFQQCLIIKKLVEKHKIPVNIVICPIFREKNGLAMSSRNERLSNEEREQASIISETLKEAKRLFETKSAEETKKWVEDRFKKVENFDLEYFQIAEEDTLIECTKKNSNTKYRAFIAVFVNNIRLIDTISLN